MYYNNLLSKEEINQINNVYVCIKRGLDFIFLSFIPLFLGIFYALLLVALAPDGFGIQMLVSVLLFAMLMIAMFVMNLYATTTVQSREWEEMLKKIDRNIQPTFGFSYDQDPYYGNYYIDGLANSDLYRLLNPEAEANSMLGPEGLRKLEAERYLYPLNDAFERHIEDIANRTGLVLDEKKGLRWKIALLSIIIVTAVFILQLG